VNPLPGTSLTNDNRGGATGSTASATPGDSITITVGGHYPLADAEQAHRDLQGRRTTGSIVLLP